jgi:hypothetical protein
MVDAHRHIGEKRRLRNVEILVECIHDSAILSENDTSVSDVVLAAFATMGERVRALANWLR